MTDKDQRFLTSKQAPQKLEIAVTRYFCDHLTDTALLTQYRNFLRPRSFPALQWILHHSSPDVLKRLLDTGWLTENNLKRGLEEDDVPTAMRVLLIRALNPDFEIPSAETTLAPPDILTAVQLRLFKKIPHLRFAISGFQFVNEPEIEIAGTDGESYYVNQETFQILADLERFYFHSVIHCLWLHINVKKQYQPRLWNLATDISASYLSDSLLGNDTTAAGCERREFYTALEETVDLSLADSIYRYFLQNALDSDTLSDLETLFRMDDHTLWYTYGGQGLNKWKHLNKSTGSMFASPVKKRFGLTPGSRMERMELRKEAKYDFHSYLRRFTITEEELQTDMDTFDYIPYMYGLEHYGNLPLIEPLEYTDANKVEELVIAIDTSGSCDEHIVQQFLAETRRLLTDKRNFFRHMNVHIIQCDSMIQDHAKIESVEDWNRYIANIKIIGRGGTDFTPVFTYTDKLIAEGELHHLKGLLYFTDGDGVYPKQAPRYETAFVFTDKRFLDFPVPDWAVRLCLNLN